MFVAILGSNRMDMQAAGFARGDEGPHARDKGDAHTLRFGTACFAPFLAHTGDLKGCVYHAFYAQFVLQRT